MNWAIFYGNGSTCSSEQCNEKTAPHLGVVAIVQDHITPAQVLHQTDFYWWRDGHWWAGDIHGFLDQAARYGATWVKQGEMLRSDRYKEILGRAIQLKAEWDGRRN